MTTKAALFFGVVAGVAGFVLGAIFGTKPRGHEHDFWVAGARDGQTWLLRCRHCDEEQDG